MKKIQITQARQRPPSLIDEVAGGAEFTITRHGRAVAVLTAAPNTPKQLPSLTKFRRNLGRLGTPAAQLLSEERDTE